MTDDPVSDPLAPQWAAGVAAYLVTCAVVLPWAMGPWAHDWLARAAIACVAIAPAWVWFAQRPLRVGPADDLRRGGWLALAAILALALVAWGYCLDDYPALLHLDAGLNAAMAKHAWERPWTPYARDLGVGTETTFFYLMGLAIDRFGWAPWSLRLAGVVAMLGFVAALFPFARALFGRPVALVAALGVALAPGLNEMARTPQHHLLVPGALCAAMWVALRAFERGGAWRYLLAGVAFGSHAWLYHGYRANALANPLFVPLAAWLLAGDARPKDIRRGLIAGLVGYVVAIAPCAAFAWREPELWMTPFAQQLAGDPPPLPARAMGALEVVAVAFVDRPGEEPGGFDPLAILGLAALPLAFRYRGVAGLALAWLVVTHLLPPMVPWQHRAAPRRYVGLLPALAILPALAYVELWRAMGPRARRAWALAGIAGAIATLVVAHTRLVRPPGADAPEAERYRVLRGVLAAVEAHPEWTAYLPAGYHLHGFYNLRYFFEHPRIVELETDAWWTITPARDALLVDTGSRADEVALRMFPGAKPVVLTLPTRGEARVGTARLVSRAMLGSLRPQGLADHGWLAVPEAGRYRIEVDAGAKGALRLAAAGDTSPRDVLAADGRAAVVELALAAGCYRYRIARPVDSPVWIARWSRLRAGVASAATPLELACWRPTLEGSAAQAAWPGIAAMAFERAPPVELARAGIRPQDVAMFRGGYAVAFAEGIARLDGEGALDPGFVLRDAAGEPLFHPLGYGVPQPKTFSLAATKDGLVVASRDERWVRVFDGEGAFVAELTIPGGWREPLDVACSPSGRIAVADRARARVQVFDPAFAVAEAVSCEPISLDFAGEAVLAVCERARGLVRIEGGRVVEGMPLDGLGRATRVAVCGDVVVVTHRRRLRAFDLALRPLAIAGDPAALDPVADCGDLMGAAWDEEARTLAFVTEFGHLERFAAHARPWPDEVWRPGLDHAGTDLVSGNVSAEPGEFGVGLAIDGGERPAWARYAFEIPAAGRYAVWVLHASGDARPVTIEAGEARIDWDGEVTGGFAREHLGWSRAGELELPVGAIELEVVAAELFPHVARISLVRVDVK